MFQSKILRFAIDAPGYRPTVEEVISIITNARNDLQKRDIILAIENHDRLTVHDFLKIIRTVDSEQVGICLDCANSLGIGEGFKEVVQQLAPYSVNFHLKEVFIKRKYHMMGFDIEGKSFGEGFLPLEWMLKQLPAKCKTAILEQWTPPETSIDETIKKELDWAIRGIHFLSNFFEVDKEKLLPNFSQDN
jgi:3-oxoisoapionate decarboxylase